MRNILRLSLTLAVVGVVSAALLTGMYNLTAPIIAAREEADYREALECCFPEFDTFETVQLEEDKFDLLYDEKGDLVGVMATAGQQGYDGEITYNLAVDPEGKIVTVIIISHSETPGVGDIITTDAFLDQFIGKSYEDPLTAGEDVDTVSGATISTSAMIGSIRRVTGVIAENFLGVESEKIDISAVPDGTYTGSAPGVGGPITVEVEVAGGKIISIEVVEHNETPTYFIESYPLIPNQIIANQDLEGIDTKTGATMSAEGIINAVRDALTGGSGKDSEASQEEDVDAVPEPVDISAVPDGTYTGSAPGVGGPITVEVEVAGGKIISIEVVEHNETPEYFTKSYPLIPDQIIANQDLEGIDTKTGATMSAGGIINAVRDALAGALEDGS